MNNNLLKEHFEEFLSTYDENNKNQIWASQSKEFHEFWQEKIMNSDYEELNDQEVDDIVKILDTHGKGNTPTSESIARVMIPQGAWRRLFNQIHENQSLSKAMESIFNASSCDEKLISIDNLYSLNKGNKNNLTGQSGNAINCFLAAYDPFENLSIVSQNDRAKLLSFLGIKISNENTSIGAQIVESAKLIKEKFKEADIHNNARTISYFAYSKPFINFWKKGIENTLPVIPEESPDIVERIVHDNFIFYMEKQLEDFLIENWDKTELGKKYDLIMGKEGLVSQQFMTDIGKIDILAKDKEDGKFVVIELKKNQTSDDTIGQIARYMGWVEEHLSEGAESKGIIIAGKYDNKLKYAMRKIKGIEVYLYKVDFQLKEYIG